MPLGPRFRVRRNVPHSVCAGSYLSALSSTLPAGILHARYRPESPTEPLCITARGLALELSDQVLRSSSAQKSRGVLRPGYRSGIDTPDDVSMNSWRLKRVGQPARR